MDRVQRIWLAIYESMNLAEGDLVAKLGLWFAFISLLVATAALHYSRVPLKRAKLVERQQHERFGFAFIDREECEFALQHYVQPDCSTVDPSGEDDLRALIPSRQAVYKFFDTVFEPGSKYRHIIVLAETGMGKTSLLYNLLSRNTNKSERNRQRMLYIPLGRPGVIEKISEVENKNETILLLDAFDEDTDAVQDHRVRMTALMSAAADFKRVIITCRTQFFTRDEEIPRQSGVVRMGPRAAGDSGEYLLYKTYLAPFDNAQIKKWTRKRFGFFRRVSISRAHSLIGKIPELAVRPFLLTALPDLLKDKVRVENVYELYAYMVKKWLEREARWIEPSRLLEFSRKVAVDVYLNRTRRMAERLPFEELERHFDVSIPADGWKFKSRSLLNRDSEGNFKFAHRSIMEFIFVESYLQGDQRCLDSVWTDFMIELFWKAVESSLSGRELSTPIRETVFFNEDHRTAKILKEGIRLGALDAWKSDAQIAKSGRSDQYADLFIRIGAAGETLAICDLLKNRIYLVLIAAQPHEGSAVFAVGEREIEGTLERWNAECYLGLQRWERVSDREIARLSRFSAVRREFQPQGVRLWATNDTGRLAVVNIASIGAKDSVTVVPTWKERLVTDPRLEAAEVTAVLVLAAHGDAEEFYFGQMRQ